MDKPDNKTIYLLAAVVVSSIIGLLLLKLVPATNMLKTYRGDPPDGAIIAKPAPESCTIFTAAYGNTVLLGNNEDYINPNTYYWVTPSKGGDYGAVYFGFDNFWPQGGINEKGLAYDVNALPKAILNPHPELPRFKKSFYAFLKTCSTVAEVIDRVKSYSWERSWRAQVHVADRKGDAVVISAGPDGEIAFTRKLKGNGFLVSTNFNRSNPQNGRYPCRRYDTAVTMLEKIQAESDLTAEYFRSILDAVHQEGPSVNTVYSNIFDLKNGIIYLYHWHQFNEVATLNVAEEIERKFSPTPIKDLFSQETVALASKTYLAAQRKITPWRTVAWVWFFLTAISLVALIGDRFLGKRAFWGIWLIWLAVVALFGPLGLLACRYSYRQPLHTQELQPAEANWRCALGEVVFGVAGYAIGTTLAFASFYLILSFNESSLWSVVARIYGLPLIIGLFFFHTPLLSVVAKIGYWAAVRRRFLSALMSLNIMLAGLLPVSGILLALSEKHLGLMGPGSVLFWGVIALGAIAGALVLYPFSIYMTHRGFSCWPSLVYSDNARARGENAFLSVRLSNSWGALLLSFTILIGTITVLFSSL